MNITEKNIKTKLAQGEKALVAENIKYPFFEDENNKALCDRMNGFYKCAAQKYSNYGSKILMKKILRLKRKCDTPLCLSMNFTTSTVEDKIITVVLDLTYAEGKKTKMRRFSQMWSIKHREMLTPSSYFRLRDGAKNIIKNKVLEIAEKNGENPGFGYFEDYLARLEKSFSFNNCFALASGVAFFVQGGVLCPEKYGASTFIVDYNSLSDFVRADFLPCDTVKAN